MAERIHIEPDVFEKRTTNISNACLRVTANTKDVPIRNSCKGIKLQEYVNKVSEVANLLWRYQTLLLVDVKNVVKSAETIEQADREAEKVWKVITQK